MKLGEGAMLISSFGFAISRPTSTSSSSYLVSSRIFGLATSSLLWTKNKSHLTNTKVKPKLYVRNSAQEIPQTLEEESKFAPLDPQDPQFGPPVSFFHPLNLCLLLKKVCDRTKHFDLSSYPGFAVAWLTIS